MNTPWVSFKKYLLLDRAIPFHIPHQRMNPELVTRATAMKAGWVWQIPLKERIGAGYVFSSRHTNEKEAIQEIETYFKTKIEPQGTLKFEPDHFSQVWQGNIVALGLASGFVEPLEATSIGQMLEQLRMLAQTIVRCGWLVSDLSIEQYNQANTACWEGIRDFLRMHYDCPRRDTQFWKDIAATPYTENYKIIREIFSQRLLRNEDLKGYTLYNWQGIFYAINWMFVAQALGLISKQGCLDELKLLPQDKLYEIGQYIKDISAIHKKY